MEEKTGLKPCPFCGAKVALWDKNFNYGVVKVIECKNCNVRFVFPWNKAETPVDLCELWNRRAGNVQAL